MDEVIINKEEMGDSIVIYITPEEHPIAFGRKVEELVSLGMPRDEAEITTLRLPFQMEIFYEGDGGLFAVEAECINYNPVYNPYTGKEIQKV